MTPFLSYRKNNGEKDVQFCRERNIVERFSRGICTDDPYLQELVLGKYSLAFIDAALETKQEYIGTVSTDNIAAFREMATYLLENNHRDIVVVAGKHEAYVDLWRLQGVANPSRIMVSTLLEDRIINDIIPSREPMRRRSDTCRKDAPPLFSVLAISWLWG